MAHETSDVGSQEQSQTGERPRSLVVTLVLAESYPILLEGMEHVFRAESNFRVLACCTDGNAALRAVQRHRPDVLVLDFHLRGKSALPLLREVGTKFAPTRVVLLAERPTEDEVADAVQYGARGLVLKSMPSRRLVQCIRKVHQGATWIEESSVGRTVDWLLRQAASEREVAKRLTRRELDVLRMAVGGESNKEIADKLTVSEGTVKAHLHHVYEKLGVKGRLELVLYAHDTGLLSHSFPAGRETPHN